MLNYLGAVSTLIPPEGSPRRLRGYATYSLAYGNIRTAKEITDGHLTMLASANGAVLATLHENIPGSHLIPKKFGQLSRIKMRKRRIL
jgi:hypothetical protein